MKLAVIGKVRPHTPRFPIVLKFGLLVLVMSLLSGAMVFTALNGMADQRTHLGTIYREGTRELGLTARLPADIGAVANQSLAILNHNSHTAVHRLENNLATNLIPRVNADLSQLGPAMRDTEGASVARLSKLWRRFVELRASGALDSLESGPTADRANAALAARLESLFDPMFAAGVRAMALQTRAADRAYAMAFASYNQKRSAIVRVAIALFGIGLLLVSWLAGVMVIRVRRYSRFALTVASGDTSRALRVSGNDELTVLGNALNEMVAARRTEERAEREQGGFVHALQLANSEAETFGLLKRHLERAIASSTVTSLTRADRLRPATPVGEGSALELALRHAEPRSCLAIRHAEPHESSPEHPALGVCRVCGGTDVCSSCTPLIVGGEVIGSVLVQRPGELSDAERRAVRESVWQAAPVIGNLRNLAIAEHRAATDSLTGLPNRRFADLAVRRIVAQADRSGGQLAALSIDLDHFKVINDTHGHAVGDEVLAAVGAVFATCVRESDFIGRVGGEEFLALLFDTDLAGARLVAEKLRSEVSSLKFPDVTRSVTVSIGIATLPGAAVDARELLMSADRALYAAKRAGRDRVEVFGGDAAGPVPESPVALDDHGEGEVAVAPISAVPSGLVST